MGLIRTWLRVPDTTALLLAICGAAYAAVALGALGGFLGWRTAPPLPSDAEAVRMARPAFLPGATAEPRRWDFVFDDNPKYTDPRWVYLVGGTDEYERGKVFFTFTYPSSTPARAVVDGARQRMRAAGWQPGPTDPSGCCPYAALRRAGWLVEIADEGYVDESHHELEVAVTRATPDAVPLWSGAGLLLGAVAGWPVMVWAIRRTRTSGPVRRAVATVLSGVAALALLPATAMSAAALVGGFLPVPGPEDAPAWVGYTFILFRPLAYLGTLIAVGVLLLIAVPRAGDRRVPG